MNISWNIKSIKSHLCLKNLYILSRRHGNTLNQLAATALRLFSDERSPYWFTQPRLSTPHSRRIHTGAAIPHEAPWDNTKQWPTVWGTAISFLLVIRLIIMCRQHHRTCWRNTIPRESTIAILTGYQITSLPKTGAGGHPVRPLLEKERLLLLQLLRSGAKMTYK